MHAICPSGSPFAPPQCRHSCPTPPSLHNFSVKLISSPELSTATTHPSPCQNIFIILLVHQQHFFQPDFLILRLNNIDTHLWNCRAISTQKAMNTYWHHQLLMVGIYKYITISGKTLYKICIPSCWTWKLLGSELVLTWATYGLKVLELLLQLSCLRGQNCDNCLRVADTGSANKLRPTHQLATNCTVLR